MFYAILGIIVVVALFLLFRDDHDDSYNKSEKGQRKAQQPQPKQEQPQYHEKSGPSLKEQFRGQIKEQVHLLGEVDLSFLDNIEYNEALEENTDTFDINDLEYHGAEWGSGKEFWALASRRPISTTFA